MPWSTIQIDGKQAEVFVPQSAPDEARAIIYLHSHGLTTLNDNAVFTAEFERHGFRVICPHGQRSWWLDTICEEFDPQTTPLAFVRDTVMEWIQSEWKIAPPAIGLLGVSMGGQGILQLAYRQPFEFPTVVAISPAIDFYQWYNEDIPLRTMFPDQESARQAGVVLQINPLHRPKHQLLMCDPTDEWIDGVDRLSMKLSSSGILFDRDLETSHGGHSWDYFNHVAAKSVEYLAKYVRGE